MIKPGTTVAAMTPMRAAAIADEQIRYWRAAGWSAQDAWRALDLPCGWREVRIQMIRWLRKQAT